MKNVNMADISNAYTDSYISIKMHCKTCREAAKFVSLFLATGKKTCFELYVGQNEVDQYFTFQQCLFSQMVFLDLPFFCSRLVAQFSNNPKKIFAQF